MMELTKDIPELRASFSVVGFGGQTNSGIALWAFKDWAERERSQKELQQEIQGQALEGGRRRGLVFAPPSLPGAGGGLPISMVIQSTSDPSQVYEIAEQVKQKAQESGRFIVVQNSLAFDAPQATITIDRDRAAALNLPISEIGATLNLLVGGGAIAQFDRDSNSYDIIMQVPEEFRGNPEHLGNYYVRSRHRRDGAAVGGGFGLDQRVACRDPAVQPAEFRDDLGAAAARRHHRRRAEDHRGHRPPAAARRLLHRLFRPVAAREGAGQHDRHRLRCWRSWSSIWCSPRSSRASAIR